MKSQKSVIAFLVITSACLGFACLVSLIFSADSVNTAKKAIRKTDESIYYVEKQIEYITLEQVAGNKEIRKIGKLEKEVEELKKLIESFPKCECKKPVTSEPVKKDDAPVANAVITIYKLPGCKPCDDWVRVEKPKLEAATWVIKEAPATGSAPSFLIELNGKSHCHEGYLSMGSLKYIIENHLK